MGSRRTRDREQGAWSCRRVRSQRGFGYSRIRDRVGHRLRPDHSSRTAGRPPRSSAITCAARSMTAAAKLRSIRVRVGCGSSATEPYEQEGPGRFAAWGSNGSLSEEHRSILIFGDSNPYSKLATGPRIAPIAFFLRCLRRMLFRCDPHAPTQPSPLYDSRPCRA